MGGHVVSQPISIACVQNLHEGIMIARDRNVNSHRVLIGAAELPHFVGVWAGYSVASKVLCFSLGRCCLNEQWRW